MNPHGVVANIIDCNLIVNEFKLKSHYYIHFWTYTFPKGKVKLVTLVEGDPLVPFSIATTPRCRREHYSIPWIAPLYPWSLPYSSECLARRYQVPFFESLVWLDLGLNPSLSDHWWILYSLSQWLGSSSYQEELDPPLNECPGYSNV